MEIEADAQATEAKKRRLEELRDQAKRLEAELDVSDANLDREWRPTEFYAAYYATTGFMLGIFGAIGSLLFNVIGSVFVGKTPLELIRIYLTFPLGENALKLSTEAAAKTYAVSDHVILAFGCCLYLGMGMLLGIPVYLAVAKFAPRGPFVKRLAIGAIAALLIWVVNFYGILSWLQPLLFGGRWILDSSLLPWWVAAAQHAVFGLIVAALYPLGEYDPYRRPALEMRTQATL